jgi:colicin import membrane protein
MRSLQGGIKQRHLLDDSASINKSGLLKAGIFSLLLHMTLVAILTFGLRPTMTNMELSVYRVTIRPFSPHGNGTPLGSSTPGSPGLPGGSPTTSLPDEKLKPVGNQKGSEKVGKRVEKSERGEKLEAEKGSRKALQDALEDIRKKAALEEIQKRVARREKLEKGPTEGSPTTHPSKGSAVSGAGTGTGSGTASGSLGSPTGGSRWGSSYSGSSVLESKLNEYYDRIWEKIKKEWTLPGNLPKGKTDLETIIVVVIERDGKIQKSWFEKKSGNAHYDQMSMRAIKKADPLPPIPKEFSDNTFEIGIRFHPD